MTEKEKEMVGYKQQPGKLPFSKPGSGGKNSFSKPIEENMIPSSQGGKLQQPWGSHRHDSLVSGQVIGKDTALVDGNWKVTGQAHYGDDVRIKGELIGRIVRSPALSVDQPLSTMVPLSRRHTLSSQKSSCQSLPAGVRAKRRAFAGGSIAVLGKRPQTRSGYNITSCKHAI